MLYSSPKHKKRIVIGKIFADWCGHCTALKPEWEKFKRIIKQNMGRSFKNIQVEFLEFGDTVENKLKNITVEGLVNQFNQKHLDLFDKKLEYNGFPTIFKYCVTSNGKKTLEYFNGERTATDLWKWYKTSECQKEQTRKMTKEYMKKPLQLGGSRRKTEKNKSKKLKDLESRPRFTIK